jgi:hypothetical protein
MKGGSNIVIPIDHERDQSEADPRVKIVVTL